MVTIWSGFSVRTVSAPASLRACSTSASLTFLPIAHCACESSQAAAVVSARKFCEDAVRQRAGKKKLFGKRGDTGGGQWGDLVGSVFSSIFGGADGFASGGYTGAGSKNKPAGVVHKGEYVFSADAVSRLGLDFLSGLDRGWIGEDGEEQRSGVTLLVPPVRSTPIILA